MRPQCTSQTFPDPHTDDYFCVFLCKSTRGVGQGAIVSLCPPPLLAMRVTPVEQEAAPNHRLGLLTGPLPVANHAACRAGLTISEGCHAVHPGTVQQVCVLSSLIPGNSQAHGIAASSWRVGVQQRPHTYHRMYGNGRDPRHHSGSPGGCLLPLGMAAVEPPGLRASPLVKQLQRTIKAFTRKSAQPEPLTKLLSKKLEDSNKDATSQTPLHPNTHSSTDTLDRGALHPYPSKPPMHSHSQRSISSAFSSDAGEVTHPHGGP